MPFFSIVMPTRNRAQLLKESLPTALFQEFQDYEIIISDNNSQDNTKEVADFFMRDSKKIRYVNSGRDLSMCESWEFALKHAEGKYIIYLSDDDALLPISLKVIHEIISHTAAEIVVWKRAVYHHHDLPKDPGLFQYKLDTGELGRVDSKKALDAFFLRMNGMNDFLPKMMNSAVSRKAIQTCLKKTGVFFLPPYPDYSAACHLLGSVPHYQLLNRSLYLFGMSSAGNSGHAYDRKQKTEAYLSLFKGDLLKDLLDDGAMRYLIPSYYAATQVLFSKIYPDRISGVVNKDNYFKACFESLLYYAAYEDVSEERTQLRNYMKKYYDGDDQFQALSLTSGKKISVSPWMNRKLLMKERAKKFPGVALLLRTKYLFFLSVSRVLVFFLHSKRPDRVYQHKCSSILQAAQILSSHLSSLGEQNLIIPVVEFKNPLDYDV